MERTDNKSNHPVSVDNLMKKSLAFALVATIMTGTSNISSVKNHLTVTQNEQGVITVQEQED